MAPPEGALGRRYDLVDLCDTGLPCTVILDQTAEVVEDKAQPGKQPDESALHDGTNILDLVVPADFERTPNQPDRDVSEHAAILFPRTVPPELLRDRKSRHFGRMRLRQPPQYLTMMRIGHDLYR